MRIVSGKWRSKRITAPKNLPTRPTTDFAKESLFNVLNNRFDFEEIRVLDLFSGTGNISYEFASRGTVDLTAVDQNRNCARFITATSDALDAGIHVVQADATPVCPTRLYQFRSHFCGSALRLGAPRESCEIHLRHWIA